MALHADTKEILGYLQNVMLELVDPFEVVLRDNWEEGDHAVDGRNSIWLELLVIGLHFASIDRDLSEDEAAFIADIREFFIPDELVSSNYSMIEYRDFLRKLVIEARDSIHLDQPLAIGYLKVYDDTYGTEYADKARSMFFRFVNAITKADGKVTKAEKLELLKYKEILFDSAIDSMSAGSDSGSNTPHQAVNILTEEPKSLDELFDQLKDLIGLEGVKNDVMQLVNFIKVQQIRESKGLVVQPISRHLVFYGNPGTGKTTIARLLAQIYKSLGILNIGNLVETDRSGLVAGYVGQTALKVSEVVKSSLGGILFIDEAYSLNSEGGQDFGQEAVDTLLKLMEDNRDNLIVVVAGYTDKMNAFMSSNPGLRSRFNKYLSFEDYRPTQLVEIFELFCKKACYQICQPTRDILLRLFSILYETRDDTFGNARLARNIFEMTISNQANRIVAITDITEENLSTITEEDIPGMADMKTIS